MYSHLILILFLLFSFFLLFFAERTGLSLIFVYCVDRKIVELTGDVTPDARAIRNSDVIVTTPEKWDGISRSWQTREYVKDVALIVIDEIHLLGEDRGPVLEVFLEFIHTSRGIKIVKYFISIQYVNVYLC